MTAHNDFQQLIFPVPSADSRVGIWGTKWLRISFKMKLLRKRQMLSFHFGAL